ncbi:MAG: carbohydrate binding family 9 domain-containing protein [Bacteroidales bacterium]|nr:carbohydrate binding family 9 domain-containing protein [Bacteroidales bacterium]
MTFAKNQEKKTYTTKKIETNPPLIDGKIDDKCWENVDWGDDFIQREPYEGKAPSQETKFKILYDDKYMYIAFRCYDTEPDSIVRRISRRDGFEGDFVEVNIDSYNDKRTAFSFTLTAASVKGDEMVTNNGNNWDQSWDPIWYGKSAVDNEGWTAEMKIPLSQLRYSDNETQIWGLQLTRRLFRKDERSNWQFIPRDAPGWVHLFGELQGITNIKSQKQIELLPYVVGKAERYKKEKGNPFATGKDMGSSAGLDGKIGITSNLTLDFTFNPDFGQVEADPSEVNLSAYETFFREKRPFFIEGKDIMNFQLTGGDGDFSGDNLFYSRRIGRRQHYYPDVNDGEYIDNPENTKIIAAGKLTGKTKNGYSIGVMESITSNEFAVIDSSDTRRKIKVEPLTNYCLGRVQKDFNEGNTLLGGIFTATNRNISSDELKFIHKDAYSGGIDFSHHWKDRTYYFNFKTLFSHVAGDKEAILNTQESSARYFQRPDASHVSLDSNRTSLSGHGGNISIGKSGNGHFSYGIFVTWRSPELELNDIGYLRRSDQILEAAWIGYRIWEPFSIFRSFRVNSNQWRGWDFSGKNTFDGGNINFHVQFKNYWYFSSGTNRQGRSISNYSLRGGPSMKNLGGWSNWFNINSDSRKKISLSFGGWNQVGDKSSEKNHNFWGGITARPADAIRISLYPSYSYNKSELQYVETVDFNSEKRYIFAALEQKTLSMSLRVNYSITPDLSVQFWGQPFISTGKYFNYKKITNPDADEFSDRYYIFSKDNGEIIFDSNESIWNVFEDPSNQANSYSFDNPEYKFIQFRSNFVVRWEYIPGSTLYIVWSQGRTDCPDYQKFALTNDMNNLIDIRPHNIFLIKFSYLFNL